jgi:hypothetical protein
MAEAVHGADLALGPHQQSVRELAPDENGDDADPQVGDEAYKDLINELRGDDYASEMSFLARANLGLAKFFMSFTISWHYRLSRGAARERLDLARWSVFDLMIGLLVRLLNHKIWVFQIVVLSLFALRCKVPRIFWDVLASMRLLYSQKHTRNIATDMGNLAMHPLSIPASASKKIMLAVYDNCLEPHIWDQKRTRRNRAVQ